MRLVQPFFINKKIVNVSLNEYMGDKTLLGCFCTWSDKHILNRILTDKYPHCGLCADEFLAGKETQKHRSLLKDTIEDLVRCGDYYSLIHILTYLYAGEVQRDLDDIDTVLQDLHAIPQSTDTLTVYTLYQHFVDTLFTFFGKTHCSLEIDHIDVAIKLVVCRHVLSIPDDEIPDGVPPHFYDRIYEQITDRKVDEDDAECFALGVLMSLLPIYQLTNDTAACLHNHPGFSHIVWTCYPMEKYILPLFLKYPDSLVGRIRFVECLDTWRCQSLHNCAWETKMTAEQMRRLLQKAFANKDFLRECMHYHSEDVCKLEEYTGIGALLATVVTKHTTLLKNNQLSEDTIAELFLWSLVLLFTADKHECCISLLRDDNNKALVPQKYRQEPLTIILIGKLCATCDDKDDAENLKVFLQVGLSDKKLLAQRQEVLDATIAMCDNLLKLEDFIRHNCDEQEVDLLYGNGKIQKFVQRWLAAAHKNTTPLKNEYNDLCNIAKAFSRSDYVLTAFLWDYISDGYTCTDDDGYTCTDDENVLCIYGENYHTESRKLQEELHTHLEERTNLLNTHFAQLEDPNGWFALKMAFDRYLADLAVQSAIADFDKVKQLRAAGTSDEDLLKELEEQAQYLIDIFYRYPDYNQDVDAAEDLIETHMKDFVDRFLPDRTNKNLFDSLSRRTRKNVEKYLVTSQLVYNFLSSTGTPDQLDYSSALISLTKAIEFVLAEKLYTPMKANVENPNYSNANKTRPNKDPKKLPESLGAYISYIWDILKPNAKRANNYYPITDSNGTWTVTDPNKHFDYYGGNDCLDIPLLKKFKHISLFTLDYTLEDRDETTVPIEKHFGDNDEENRLLLACALDYIRAKYRNPVAHKDPVAKELFESAQLSLLYEKEHQNAQALLFVLLSIVK